MFERFISKKKIPESQDTDFSNVLKAITYKKKNVNIVGSSVLKAFKYNSDIDLFEYFPRQYSNKDVASALQQIVKKTQSKYYITDIKSGINEKYNIFHNLGYIKDGQLLEYDYTITQQSLDSIESDINNYIELSELNTTTKNGSVCSWLEMREGIRKLFTIRWTIKQVLDGYQKIDDKIIKLEDCIPQFLTKIDVVFNFNGTYTEISNLLLSYQSEKHAMTFLPIISNMAEAEMGLKYSLYENLHSKKKKYLKIIKRVFSLAKMFNDVDMMKKITPIFDSNIALLAKVASILETLLLILEKVPDPPMISIRKNIDECKTTLSNIYQFPFKERIIDIELTEALKLSKTQLTLKLEDIVLVINHIVNNRTQQYIKENRVMPLPKKYML